MQLHPVSTGTWRGILNQIICLSGDPGAAVGCYGQGGMDIEPPVTLDSVIPRLIEKAKGGKWFGNASGNNPLYRIDDLNKRKSNPPLKL
jgi:hypothetical protein